MAMDLFSSNGASLLVLLVQGLFAWALWTLRRAFVRQEDYLLHIQRDTRREATATRRLNALEEALRVAPGNADMAGLHTELAALRGEMQALNVRISALDKLLDRLEHNFERQEDRLHLAPQSGRPFPCRPGAEAAGGCN